ncbi:MAG: hypothetical protein NC432_11825 [Roseburia sp.]|nr:hypothetical protein [Roseburia sp.]MCM1099495.1 hypothetical protein [Ruminococcus flavefaciens]
MLKDDLAAKWPEIKVGRGMIGFFNLTTEYYGYYVKYSESLGSINIIGAGSEALIWTISSIGVTLKKIVTAEK